MLSETDGRWRFGSGGGTRVACPLVVMGEGGSVANEGKTGRGGTGGGRPFMGSRSLKTFDFCPDLAGIGGAGG